MPFLDILVHQFPDIYIKIVESIDRPTIGTTTKVIRTDKNPLYTNMSHYIQGNHRYIKYNSIKAP